MVDAANTAGRGPRRGEAALPCPNCGARIEPRAADVGRSVECPDCFTPVVVPVDFVVPVTTKSRPAARGGRRVPKQVPVICACGTRFQAAVRKAAYEIECLVCAQPVRVPGAADLLKPRESEADAAAAAPSPKSGPTVFDRMAEIRQVEGPALPRWTFFSGVFTMPWHPEAVVRWLYLSAGFALWGVAGTGTLFCALGGGPLLYGAFAFGKAFLWLTILVGGYCCSCCLAILADTEQGQDTIEGWPEPFWLDWFFDLLRVAAMQLTVAAVAFGLAAGVCVAMGHPPTPLVGSLASPAGAGLRLPFVVPMAAAEFLLFPIVLLSTLDSGSIWMPFSATVLRSLGRAWWAWLLFYALSSVLTITLCLLAQCWTRLPWETTVLAGPIIPALLLVHARLLGRLAWTINRTR